MALDIQTFSNAGGGNPLFKALGHPEAVPTARALVARLADAATVAVYDPHDQFSTFAALYDLSGVTITDLFVQDIEKVGRRVGGLEAKPVTALAQAAPALLLVAAFDSQRLVDQIRPFLGGADIVTFDALRLPTEMLTNPRHYLAPINFATNYAFFRDAGGHHTRLVTANYWAAYGAAEPRLWATLFDQSGARLATWERPLGTANATVALDSAELRRRFRLPEFTGQLFLHVIDAAGHDVVKYALDTYGDGADMLSCTHDANAWPSDLYAGLPAPAAGEQVVLWVQNSHPCPIPPRGIGLNLMGQAEIAWLDREVAPFATLKLDVAELMPRACWPQQLEVQAGKYVVRPRYEITNAQGRQRLAHLNVERADLKPDPGLRTIGNLMGKGFILPAPILPVDRFATVILPTPMSTAQRNLPIAAILCDAGGAEVARHRFGLLDRSDSVALEIDRVLDEAAARLPSGYGHVELIYDFSDGGDGDGWLHGIFRYHDRSSGHAADTSFGSHIFNTVLTYRNEPQSYAGRPPGLTTRLFLRLGHPGTDAMCHLIYPASTPWHAFSTTTLTLIDANGRERESRAIRIACGGSHLFQASGVFDAAALAAAGPGAYILIRDPTCRLFGYHGLVRGAESFSLDHMFGF